MEDLIGLIAFIIFAAINIMAQTAKKNRNRKPVSPENGEQKNKPSSLEEFFENLAEKLDPKEPELPEWPEGYAKPDYMREMREFNEARQAEPAPPPVPEVEPVRMAEKAEEEILPEIGKVSLKTAMKSVPALAGTMNMRFAATPMFKSRHTTGSGYRISLKNRSELKKAMIANLIFSPPRAYDSSIENTIISQ